MPKERLHLPRNRQVLDGRAEGIIVGLRAREVTKAKVIVTGGSGFIGSHVVKALQAKWKVVVLDIKPPSESKVEFHRADLEAEVPPARLSRDVACVVHLAGRLGVARTESDPLKTLDGNIKPALNMLEFCRRGDIPKLMFSSSSEVYGQASIIPTPEDAPLQPFSVYSASKITCEQYIRAYSKKYGIKFGIMRYFNVYGPGQSTDFAIPRFISLALKGKPMIVFDGGRSVRAFSYVSDAVDGTMRMMVDKRADNNTFNIGNGTEPVSALQLAERIRKMLKSTSKIIDIPLEKTERSGREIDRRTPDISKATELLGYTPKVPLSEGIRLTAEYMQRTRR